MEATSRWDLSRFQAEDLYRMAITVEQGGFDFYDKVIERTEKPRVKNELRYLRDEEGRHKAFFQKQLAGTGAAGEKTIDPALRKLLETEFLKPMEDLFASTTMDSNAEALRFGVVIEQKTVDFYNALKRGQSDAAFLEDLEVIIEEERKHKQKLNIILAY